MSLKSYITITNLKISPMKKLLALLSIVFVCCISNNVKASPGDTCSNSINLPQTDTTCRNDSLAPGSTKWYTVIANGKSLSITTISLSGAPNVVNTISIYASCSGLPLATDSIMASTQDTLTLQDSSLMAGNTYYIKVTTDLTGLFKYVDYQMCVINRITSYVSGDSLKYHTVIENVCGLNFVHADTMTQIRSRYASPPFNTNGTGFPAYLKVRGLPSSCDSIMDAYLYWTESYFYGYNLYDTIDVTNPAGKTFTGRNAFVIGQGYPKGWGEKGTAAYKANITNTISGNGLYKINIVPPFDGYEPDTEIDGLTLIIIYKDLSASYQGNIELDQGLMTNVGYGGMDYSVSSYDQSGLACLPGSNADAFAILSDVQANLNGGVHNDTINGVPLTSVSNDFWNFDEVSTTVTTPTVLYQVYTNNGAKNDAYSMCVAGLYWQCGSCSPYVLTVTASPDTICPGQSSTLTASGGASSYQWSTGATTSSIVVNPGVTTTYTVIANGSINCPQKDSITVVVAPFPRLISLGPDTLCAPACDTLKEPVYPGQTYSWSPATGLSCTNCPDPVACPTVSTTYTVTATNIAGCKISATAIVIVGTPPNVTISAPYTSLCKGNSVTLCASGATNYTWNTGATTNCITVTPFVTTGYTVTGTNGTGCVGKDSITITVLPTPVANAGKNDTICFGSTLCPTIGVGPALPNVTYQWLPATGVACPTCLVTTACPTVTTTYTLIATSKTGPPFCSDTATVTIVVQNAIPPAISGELTACDSTALYTVTNIQAGYTYTWTANGGVPSSGTGTSATINFYPGGGTLYWTATSPQGCSALDSLVITPCCTDTGKNTITIFNQKASVVFPSYSIKTTLANEIIYVNGTLTFDKSVSFAGCDFKMAPNSQIIILDGDTMQLDNNICNHIHAGCGYMWSGIHILAGGYFISEAKGGNLIEDADTAVDAENTLTKEAIFQIRSKTYLNKNYIGIVIRPYNGTYSGYIRRSVITCRDFSSIIHPTTPLCFYSSFNWRNYPYDSLIAPKTSVRGYIGMLIDKVGIYTENGENVYDNLDNGISSEYSNLTVQRDTFEHINSSNINYAAIGAIGGGIPGFPLNSLSVGGSVPTANYFTDCTNGVYAQRGFKSIYVIRNKFDFKVLATNLPTDTRAVWLKNTGHTSATSVLVTYNTINDAYIGVECDINMNINATIGHNTITGFPLCPFSSPPPPVMVGVVINELLSKTAHYSVSYNKIGSLLNGIFATSVYQANIYNNNITLVKPFGFGCPGATGYGVQLNRGQSCSITNNDISTSFYSFSQNYTGIYVSTSPLTTVCSNNITGMWNGINFAGAMGLGCTCVNNSLNWGAQPNATGILLTSSTVIGPQGSASHPSDNTWNTSYPCRTYYDISSVNANLSRFFIKSGPPFSVLPGCPALLTFTSSGSAASCIAPIAPPPALFHEVAKTNVVFPLYTDTTVVLSKQGLTHILWNNKTLLADTTLNNFNDSIQKTSMGQLMTADTVLSDSTGLLLPGALSSITSVVPASNVESNMQTVSSIYLNSVINQNDSLTVTQLNTLRVLANKCPFQDGSAVYDARALLVAYDGVTLYNDSCYSERRDNAERRMKKSISDTAQNINITIYPNPNNGSFTINYHLEKGQTGEVDILTTTGIEVGEYILSSEKGKMSIINPELSNGIYLYKLVTNDNDTRVGKIVIIR